MFQKCQYWPLNPYFGQTLFSTESIFITTPSVPLCFEMSHTLGTSRMYLCELHNFLYCMSCNVSKVCQFPELMSFGHPVNLMVLCAFLLKSSCSELEMWGACCTVSWAKRTEQANLTQEDKITYAHTPN